MNGVKWGKRKLCVQIWGSSRDIKTVRAISQRVDKRRWKKHARSSSNSPFNVGRTSCKPLRREQNQYKEAVPEDT